MTDGRACNPLHDAAADHETMTLRETLAEECRMEVETVRAVIAMDCQVPDLRDEVSIASGFALEEPSPELLRAIVAACL